MAVVVAKPQHILVAEDKLLMEAQEMLEMLHMVEEVALVVVLTS